MESGDRLRYVYFPTTPSYRSGTCWKTARRQQSRCRALQLQAHHAARPTEAAEIVLPHRSPCNAVDAREAALCGSRRIRKFWEFGRHRGPGGFRAGATQGANAATSPRGRDSSVILLWRTPLVCVETHRSQPRAVISWLASGRMSLQCEAGDPHAGFLSKSALQHSSASPTSRRYVMSSLNRVASYVVIASVLALSACVLGPDRGYGRDEPHRQASDNRQHEEGDRHCNSQEEHRGDGCRDVESHR